jgi:FkbM family methyltransferase
MFHNPRRIVAKLAEGLEISDSAERLNTMVEEFQKRFAQIDKPREDCWWFEGGGAGAQAARAALRGVVRPGQTVFDVGAHVGGFSRLASRLVGPNGRVCAFEVSPRILPLLSANLARQNAWNTTVYAAAVHERSLQQIDLYHSRYLNDRVVKSDYEKPTGVSKVTTLSLDDFVETTGFAPDILKIDVEDAEWHVIRGGAETIKAHKPTVILDNSSTNPDYLKYFLANGYVALNALTYEAVTSPLQMASNQTCSHLLFLPESRAGERSFSAPCRFREVATIPSIGFKLEEKVWRIAQPLKVSAGRYVIDAELLADRQDDHMLISVEVNGRRAIQFEGASGVLAADTRYWVFDVTVEADLMIKFEFLRGDPRTGFDISRLKVRQVEGFPGLGMSYLLAP